MSTHFSHHSQFAQQREPLAAPTLERTLTELDVVRLRLMLQRQRPHQDVCDAVEVVLDAATVVPSARVSADIVTMCSQVRLAGGHAHAGQVLTLSYPQDQDVARGRISVLSPLGLALLGLREGDTVAWASPQGTVFTSRVHEIVYQPEASGELTR